MLSALVYHAIAVFCANSMKSRVYGLSAAIYRAGRRLRPFLADLISIGFGSSSSSFRSSRTRFILTPSTLATDSVDGSGVSIIAGFCLAINLEY